MRNIEPVNRTLFISDNLPVLRRLPDACIDLIATDPPFNAKRVFNAPLGSKAARQRFDDRWRWDEVTDEWNHVIAAQNPAVKEVIEAAALIEGGRVDPHTLDISTGLVKNSMAAFLCWMAPRLIEMRRVLKPTGSIYLHCDDAADSYLRLLMDAIFGRKQFRNAIIWQRMPGRTAGKQFGRVHDSILFYVNGSAYTWNQEFAPHDPEYVKRAYRNKDQIGRWQSDQLTASDRSDGESGIPWRGIDPGKVGNHWRTPTQGGMNDFIRKHNLIPDWPDAYPSVHDRLDALDAAGLIHWPRIGKGMPRLKRYLASTKGTAICDIFTDIPFLTAASKEKTGWRTQKPLTLYRRIIKASSNEDDLILDPFCGCATTCIAAEQLNRQWIGIDIDPVAEKITRSRLVNEAVGWHGTVDVRPRPTVSASDKGALRRVLWDHQGHCCANPYCRTEVKQANLHLDHRIPKVRGGSDDFDNMLGLCPACNASKGKRAWNAFLDGERAKQPHPLT